MSLKPYYEDEQAGIVLYHGDCRDVLPTLEDGSVDVLITDPPYQTLDVEVASGTTTRLVSRDQFSGKRLAASDGASWFATLSPDEVVSVVLSCDRLLKDDGARYVFTDVKSGLSLLPRLACRNVIVWDKQTIGMGYAWRRMHEWIGYTPMPKHKLRDMSFGDIIRCPGVREKAHPTEKPPVVASKLIHNSTDSGGMVLDIFAGVGSTLLAARMQGRRAIGIELDERFCEIAAQRLSQGVLFSPTPEPEGVSA